MMALLVLVMAASQGTGSSAPSLAECAAANRVPCIRELLRSGADIEARNDDDRSPLMAASEAGADEAVKELLEQGADIEAIDDSYSMNALSYAVWKGRKSTVELLLEAGAKVEPEGAMLSPLFRASVSGPSRLVSLLLEAGASVERRTRQGETPLYIASCNSSQNEKLMLLIAAGSDVDAEAHDGTTPLLCAVRHRRWNAARILLQAGADPNLMDEKGNCPLSIALERGQKDIIELLREARALPC
ncbi:MAG TPA: ankyrin repeat domain-containing protein [Planctomycetota bacterium]|nr:ankyrin repeat domain-containing protein [Planctomycetota bacterium]